jgi:plasmid maintenance system antidote protein VapI
MPRPKTRYAYDPDYAVCPGKTVIDAIGALGVSQKVFAQRIGYPEKHLTDLLSGKKPLNQETAIRLERVTGTPARIWNNLETEYRERLVRLEEKQKLSERDDFLNAPAIKELFVRGIIEKSNDTAKQVDAVLRFFGVGSIQALLEALKVPHKVALRHSVTFESDPLSLATWLRLGEQQAAKLICKPYSETGFRNALQAVRKLTVKHPVEFVPEMVRLCADAGVALVFVPEIKGAMVHGATKWLANNKAMIILNLHGKKDDIFWFTFFHEAAHILESNKEALIVDVIGNKEKKTASEQRADRFAAEHLIQPQYQPELKTLRSKVEVCSFANQLGIAPGIVVGRLQHDGVIRNSLLNDLKRTFTWKSE